jgi:transcriptional regulator with XRE-family HTH domain
MRPSPLRHPLAVLRTTIGLTQKELAEMTGRAARTIQSIELGHLSLSEELALRIAEETGVDESWLLQGDTGIPPQRGGALLAFAKENRPYTREDYEWQRAFNEEPTAPESELAEALKNEAAKGKGRISFSRAQAKALVKLAEPVMLESRDEKLLAAMGSFLKETLRSPDALLVRWKLRRLLEELAKARSVELPVMDLGLPERARKRARTRAGNIEVKG